MSQPQVAFCVFILFKSFQHFQKIKGNCGPFHLPCSLQELTSSQLTREGITLKAFGNFPDLYFERICPTLKENTETCISAFISNLTNDKLTVRFSPTCYLVFARLEWENLIPDQQLLNNDFSATLCNNLAFSKEFRKPCRKKQAVCTGLPLEHMCYPLIHLWN